MMTDKFINNTNGHFSLPNNFSLSHDTQEMDIIQYFGSENISVIDTKNGWKHYKIASLKNENFYFRMTIYFQHDILSIINFIIDDKPIEDGSWDSWSLENEIGRKDLYDQWITAQIGNEREFDWGSVNAFFDEKGASSSITLKYK